MKQPKISNKQEASKLEIWKQSVTPIKRTESFCEAISRTKKNQQNAPYGKST